jgi:hypothetical protein
MESVDGLERERQQKVKAGRKACGEDSPPRTKDRLRASSADASALEAETGDYAFGGGHANRFMRHARP